MRAIHLGEKSVDLDNTITQLQPKTNHPCQLVPKQQYLVFLKLKFNLNKRKWFEIKNGQWRMAHCLCVKRIRQMANDYWQLKVPAPQPCRRYPPVSERWGPPVLPAEQSSELQLQPPPAAQPPHGSAGACTPSASLTPSRWDAIKSVKYTVDQSFLCVR